MIKNSYTRWLSKNKLIPSIRQMGSFSTAIFLIVFLVFQGTLAEQVPAGRLLWFGSVAMLCAIVLVSAAASVVLTMREIHSGQRKLLRLANVDGKALIYGYMFKVLYHIRFLLIAAVGLSPIVVIGWAYYLASGGSFQRCTVGMSICHAADSSFAPDQIVVILLISVVLILTLVSAILTNISIGIWMALRWHDREMALPSAILLEVAGEAPIIFFFILYIAASLFMVLGHTLWLAIPVLFVATLLGVAPLPLIGLTSLGAAEKWAWHQLENDQPL